MSHPLTNREVCTTFNADTPILIVCFLTVLSYSIESQDFDKSVWS